MNSKLALQLTLAALMTATVLVSPTAAQVPGVLEERPSEDCDGGNEIYVLGSPVTCNPVEGSAFCQEGQDPTSDLCVPEPDPSVLNALCSEVFMNETEGATFPECAFAVLEDVPEPSLDLLCSAVFQNETEGATFPDCVPASLDDLPEPSLDLLCSVVFENETEGATFPECALATLDDVPAPSADLLCSAVFENETEGATFPECAPTPDLSPLEDVLCALAAADPSGTVATVVDGLGLECEPAPPTGSPADDLCSAVFENETDGATFPDCATVPDPGLGNPAEQSTTVSIAAPDSVVEGNSVVFTLTRSDTEAGAMTVTLQRTGNATATDYTLSPAADGSNQVKVTFGASATTATVTLNALRDNVNDIGETVTLTVLPGTGYIAGAPSADTVVLTNAPAPIISVGVNILGTELSEGEAATITVKREAQEDATLDKSYAQTVQLAFEGAEWPDDVQPQPPQQVVIPVDSDHTTFQLTNVDESDPDGAKTLTITVLEQFDYVVDPGTDGSVEIDLLDGDLRTVAISALDAVAREGPGESVDVGVFNITRDGPVGSSLAVNIQLDGRNQNCGATGNYTLRYASDLSTLSCTTSSVTIPANADFVNIQVVPRDDLVKEGTRAVRLNVTAVSGSYNVPDSGRSAAVELQDNDVPTVTLRVVDGEAKEAGLETAKFQVNRTHEDTGAVSVTLSYGGTAGASDFTATTTVSFPANDFSVDVTVTPLQDTVDEPDETVIATIVTPTSLLYQAGHAARTVATIVDNDVPVVDTDGDGIADSSDNCPDVANAGQEKHDTDALGDACDTDDDGDGLSDADEASKGTLPLDADSDDDGRKDGEEVTAGTDPLDQMSPAFLPTAVTATPSGSGMKVAWTVPSGIGVSRYLVFRASTPTLVGTVTAVAGQTSYDYTDAAYPGGTHAYHVQPMLPGQSGSDFNEDQSLGTAEATVGVCEAFTADTDKDGLCDREEALQGTNATVADTDEDGVSDSAEVASGSDPLVPNSVGAGEVAFARETPFWIGLVLALSTLVGLVVAIGMARRRSGQAPEGLASDGLQL